jgi:hypothetical protein
VEHVILWEFDLFDSKQKIYIFKCYQYAESVYHCDNAGKEGTKSSAGPCSIEVIG